MTFILRAPEAAPTRPSRLRRLTATIGLVSCASLGSLVYRPLAAEARPHHHSSTPAHHAALVKVGTAKLRAEPGTTGKTTALLDEGRSAVVIGRKSGWVQVRLDSGREGWLRHDLVDVAKSTVHDSPRASDNDEDSDERHRSHRHRVTEIADESGHRESDRTRRHHEEVKEIKATRVAAAKHTTHTAHVHTVSAVADSGHSADSSDRMSTPAAEKESSPAVTASLPDNGPATLADGEPAPETRTDDSSEPTSNPRGERVVRQALAYRGTPYRMGASGNGAFDCSGFTMYLFGKEGSSLPRTASEQYDKGQAIAKDKLQLGDLVFYRNTYKSGISHVGIYIGNNSFVHASGYGRGVRVDSLSGAFYVNHWAGARRPR